MVEGALKRVKLGRIVNLCSFVAIIVADLLKVLLLQSADAVGISQVGVMLPFYPAFIIWSLILLLLYSFAVYQMFPKTYNSKAIDAISPFFPFLALAHVGWVMARHVVVTDIVLTFVQFGILFACYFIAWKHYKPNESVFVWAWISVYLPWELFSCFSEMTSYFLDLSIKSFHIGAILYFIFGIISLLIVLLASDSLYGFVVVWISCWMVVAGLYRADFDASSADPLLLIALIIGLLLLIASTRLVVMLILSKFQSR
ncbi:hypothetical protein DSO57_1001520 [Entomophthora muscae]|uniref:Uncharacterized protein n=1 Tax=Entomophthora muscae TaxID=34485 RepID=A0ACC2RNZ7_9FUNG|nr:hypothetical protein DSO57_1001520 [Entomophthora muscae]